jgi:Kdo2-lipid IVA lauroyltransferase/acyltransferase
MGERPSLVRRVRSAAETAAAGSLIALARWLPRPWLLALGTAAGELAYRLDRGHTRVALKNLTIAFGDALSPSDRRRITRACWRHYGRITADAAAFHRLSAADIGTRIRYEGLEALRAAHAEGKGVLLILAHFGHWELTGYMQGLLGYPILGITKPLDNPRVELMLAGLRSGSGNEIVPKAGGVRASLRALARGICVAVMIDQDARDSGIFVPFFGRLSSTIPTVGTMHLRTGAAVVAAFSYPEADGGWRIVYTRLTFPGLTGDLERDVRRITAETTALLEARIRERPKLWLWMHRRWKTPPPADAA